MAVKFTKRAGKKSFRDTLRENNAADRFYAAMAGKEPMFQSEIRERKPRAALLTPKPAAAPLEKDIQKAILQALKLHPMVAFVGRFNSGVAVNTDGNVSRYTRFNTVAGFPDIHGMLQGGTAFYIEVKRPGGKPSDEQRDFLALIKRNGGRGGIAYSVEDALSIIGDI